MPRTVGDIASELGEPATRIRYAILRGGIRPRGKAGTHNLYAEEDVPTIRQALAGIGRLIRPCPASAEAR